MSERRFTFIKTMTLFLIAIHIILFIPFLIFSNQSFNFLLPEAVIYYFLAILTIGLDLKKNPSFAYPFLGIVICTIFMGFLIPWYLILAIPECCYAYFVIDRSFTALPYRDQRYDGDMVYYVGGQYKMNKNFKSQHANLNERPKEALEKGFNKKTVRVGISLLVGISVIVFIVLILLVFRVRFSFYYS